MCKGISIPFEDLPNHKEFIGKPVQEDVVPDTKPLRRFDYKEGYLSIYVDGENGEEERIGGVRGTSAVLEGNNVLLITGPFAPTFLVHMDE